MVAADEPSMPDAHPDFQALHVAFGRFTCDFQVKDKTFHVSGVTELSPDGRRAISHDAQGVYFSNLWYDRARKLWIDTAIYTFIGLDFTATSPGWSGGQIEFNGLVTLRDRSLPFRTTSTALSGNRSKTVEAVQDVNGDWHTLDTSVCQKA
jgi:hypothetical protein